MNFKLISAYLDNHHQPAFRLTQLKAALLHGAGEWSEITGWSVTLQSHVADTIPFYSYSQTKVLESVDGTRKAALTLRDGSVIETVLMQPIPGTNSVCVSCEVGCPMNCAFCATGQMGFKRLLTTEEITDQWLSWLPYKPSHLVFMGMGEPLHNQSNVFGAVRSLHNHYGLGWRKMSLSTSGIVPGIEALAREFPQVNLAISLHAATDPLRSKLMPLNRVYDLNQLQKAILQYQSVAPRQVMFEYLLIKGVNDGRSALTSLLTWLEVFPKRLIHVNLIRYNPTGPFEAPDPAVVSSWKRQLNDREISCSIRKNLGADIRGACGQLAARQTKT